MISLRSMGLEVDIFDAGADPKMQIRLLDQTQLPNNEAWLDIKNLEDMTDAILRLKVRGAPLIGVAASVMIAKLACDSDTKILESAQKLFKVRPTAVNLMTCVNRMKVLLSKNASKNEIIRKAVNIFEEDVRLCYKMAENGSELLNDGDQILTHCNTGGLATAGIGTALGVIKMAHEQGKKIHVFIDETRPLLQGARLTAWELQKHKIPYTLITDGMAAHLMSLCKITKAIVGSDRIAANGDFANKIGTYSVAVNCKFHKIPFLVAAPYTTVDLECESGQNIPIEQRTPNEVRGYKDISWAPNDANTYNPAFDVTPAELVSAWILDIGVYKSGNELSKALRAAASTSIKI